MFSLLRRAISNNAGNPLPRKPLLADDLFNPHKSFSRVESLLRCFVSPRSSCIRVALGFYHPSILFCQHRDIRIPKESLPYQEEFQARTWLPGVWETSSGEIRACKGPVTRALRVPSAKRINGIGESSVFFSIRPFNRSLRVSRIKLPREEKLIARFCEQRARSIRQKIALPATGQCHECDFVTSRFASVSRLYGYFPGAFNSKVVK